MSIETYYQNYLFHHGIRGQKWGKRNGPPYPLDPETDYSKEERTYDKKEKNFALTDKQKRYIRNGAIAAGAILAVAGGMYLYKNGALPTKGITNYKIGTLINLEDLSDKTKTISKNRTLQKITYRPIEDSIEHGKMYVSHLNKDNATYAKQMPGYIKRWKNDLLIDEDAKIGISKIKLKRDIKLASERDVAEAYMKANKVSRIDHASYTNFLGGLVNDNDVNTEFMSILKKKGFDGMIDYNDAQNWTKEPLILFTPKDFVDKTSSHKLRAIDKFISVMKS